MNVVPNSSFLVGPGKGFKGLKLSLKKVKMHVFLFLLIRDGDATSTVDVSGSLACASSAFGSEDALNSQEFGVAAIAVGEDGGTAVAFSVIESEDAPNSEVHGETATVLGDSGGTACAFSECSDSSFVGLFIIHCTITPSMSMRLVVLQVFLLVWGSGLVLGFGQVLVVLGLFRRMMS